MKNLIKITTVLFLLVNTITYSQTKAVEPLQEKENTTLKKQNKKIDLAKYKSFLGKYTLEEANFTLEIIEENNKLYIVTEFSKDQLLAESDTKLHEFTRGVDLELIKGNKDALKFSQNGFVTNIKRVKKKTSK